MNRLILSIYLSISIISYSLSQEVRVTSAFDTSRINIGDQIFFFVTVEQPSDLKLSLPFFKDTLCKNIEILSGPVVDSSFNQDGRTKIIEKYLITSFDSGFYQIPPVFAEMKNKDGLKRFYSDYSQLQVMRVKIAPADTASKFFDIIEPYGAPVSIGEILPYILFVTILSALAWIAIRYIRKLKKSKTGVKPDINPDPAHIIAFRELEKLRDEQLWQKGEIKNYYTKLTEILRQYLENRFKVFSLEMTTDETLDALIKTGFKKDGSFKQLKTVLTGADLVKFAKYFPEPLENESNFNDSWNFVHSTKETEAITEKNEKDDKD